MPFHNTNGFWLALPLSSSFPFLGAMVAGTLPPPTTRGQKHTAHPRAASCYPYGPAVQEGGLQPLLWWFSGFQQVAVFLLISVELSLLSRWRLGMVLLWLFLSSGDL